MSEKKKNQDETTNADEAQTSRQINKVITIQTSCAAATS